MKWKWLIEGKFYLLQAYVFFFNILVEVTAITNIGHFTARQPKPQQSHEVKKKQKQKQVWHENQFIRKSTPSLDGKILKSVSSIGCLSRFTKRQHVATAQSVGCVAKGIPHNFFLNFSFSFCIFSQCMKFPCWCVAADFFPHSFILHVSVLELVFLWL